ncbi:MAG: PEP-CTERM sorting domain-containing protein [Phycisphaerae bacterium]|nr:PEP-CTERM sorting domain-containing protein [Phycisphaerae bacterium]
MPSLAPLLRAAAMAGMVLSGGTGARAQSAFESYGSSYRTISMPPNGAGSFAMSGDALPDGRIVAATGSEIWLERSARSGVFEIVARVDTSLLGGAMDPAFLRVSPSGGRLALGAGLGKPVVVFATTALGSAASPGQIHAANASVFAIPHYDAAWADDTHLGLSAGEFGSPSSVSLLDVTSSPASPHNPVIVRNIAGASAGLAFDSSGRLFTANGYGLGSGSATGTIRAFNASDWAGGPADFESGLGTTIGRVLSGTPLMFDHEGNLAVGGGDFSAGEFGYLAVINARSVSLALAGGGPIDISDAVSMKRLKPTADPFAFHGAAFNRATGDMYVTVADFVSGTNTWYATVPEPSVWASLLAAIVLSNRRRRE